MLFYEERLAYGILSVSPHNDLWTNWRIFIKLEMATMSPYVIPTLYILISVSNTNSKDAFVQVPVEILGDAQLYLRHH